MKDLSNLAAMAALVTHRAVLAGVGVAEVAPQLVALCQEQGIDLESVQLPEVPTTESQALGDEYEEELEQDQRRRFGAFYTPAPVAAALLDLVFDGWAAFGSGSPAVDPPRVLDPSCGAGAFLVAAANKLLALGHEPTQILDHLWGVDLDPVALGVAEATLRLWAVSQGVAIEAGSGPHLRHANYLIDVPAPADSSSGPAPFDLVVGNPPFLNQLESATTRSPAEVKVLKQRFGRAAFGYGDTSALFLLAALDDLALGGRMVLVQPDSFVSAAGPAPVRAAIGERAAVIALWDADARIFDASVFVCAPVIEQGAATATVARSFGPDFVPSPSVDWSGAIPDSWAELLHGNGAPPISFAGSETVGSIATATAGFRDEFYGLAAHVVEGADDPSGTDQAALPSIATVLRAVDVATGRVPLVTSGLIEPLECRWASSSARFAGRQFRAPMVDLESLAHQPKLNAWVHNRLVPKVLVATQTKVIEAVADPLGVLVPSVPVVSVECEPDLVYRLAAVLTAPPVSAWAMRQAAGAAMSKNAIKLSARQVMMVPLPTEFDHWDRAAELTQEISEGGLAGASEAEREVQLLAVARVMLAAYGLAEDHPCLEWWRARMVSRRQPKPHMSKR